MEHHSVGRTWNSEGHTSSWWTSIAWRSAGPNGLQQRNYETFKLRDCQTGQPQRHYLELEGAIKNAFKQKKVPDSKAMDNNRCSTNNDVVIHWGIFSWRMLWTQLLTSALCQHSPQHWAAGCSHWQWYFFMWNEIFDMKFERIYCQPKQCSFIRSICQ